ncbi:hypothetical protein LNY03_29230, partial [Pseudomonas nitroreducens]|uniref:hypothetical protein n=1 Tax=Pseudomonas nitroreducens TaxID=46680 RepID=UPI001FB5F7C9
AELQSALASVGEAATSSAMRAHLHLLALVCTCFAGTSLAQDPDLYKNLSWRSVGPARGGRVATVTGVPSQPEVYWMGA